MNVEVDQFGRNTNQSNINTSNDDRSKKILDSLSEIKEQLQNKNFSPKSEPSISIPKKDLKKGDKLDGEGGFCSRGKLVTSQTSKKENLLPLGLTDHALVNKDIAKDQVITIKDVDLNLPEDVIQARKYQYNLI